jgi:alkanesulfonate monooxygenase SsuD/methylene tetrahydromethanopterin reductase-like flavin-dependent oxidoreductase (luciferase family)
LLLPYRNSVLVAKAAATLRLVSGGRLIRCVAAAFQKAESDALGADFHRR